MSNTASLDEATLDAVHDAFTAIYARLGSQGFEPLIAELRAILQHHEPAYRAFPSAWLELQRRVAETTLTVAISKHRPVDECERLLSDIRDLGFSDLHRQAQMETMYCGYCVRQGQTEPVSRLLEPLVDALRAEARRTHQDVWDAHLRVCQAMLERIDAPSPAE